MKRLLWILPLLVACTTAHVPPTTQPTTLLATQQRIADRDLGWVYDSIPIIQFRPPWVYGMYRMQVEACVGVRKDGWPRFYIAPESPFGPGYAAAYFRRADAIVFGLGNELHAPTVRHELIHWLLAPDSSHHPKYFSTDPAVGRCAGFLRSEG